MTQNKNSHLILKILVIGGLIAALVYFFHPAVGQLSLVINGEPVSNPLFEFAAIPALLIVILFTAILMFLAFLGVGMFMFMVACVFTMLGVFLVAPYLWPALVIIFLVVFVMSIGKE